MPTKKTSTIATLAAGVALGVAISVPIIASGQPEDGAMSMEEMMQMDPSKVMQMMMEASMPGDEHEFLAKLAGDYEMTAKFWMDPDAEPEVSKGTCSSELIMDGRYLVCDVDMTLRFGGMDVPMAGKAVMGYSRPLREYQTIWIDTMNTNMTVQTGDIKDGKLVVIGQNASPMGPSQLKNVYTMQPGGYDLEFYEPNPMTGEMMKTGVIEYRR